MKASCHRLLGLQFLTTNSDHYLLLLNVDNTLMIVNLYFLKSHIHSCVFKKYFLLCYIVGFVCDCMFY